MHHSSSSC
uniref:Uncharacterized protein n=1 Tax=Arundo donax TaxID=35708 RepID=A0A0A9HAM0_ARUDO